VRDSVWDSVGDSVRAAVGGPVWDSVRDSVVKSVVDSVWASVVKSVRDSVADSVEQAVADSVWESVGQAVADSVRDSVRDSVGQAVADSVWESVRDSVEKSVADSVVKSVKNSVWDSVWDSVGQAVSGSVRDSVADSVKTSVADSGYGQHDANWLAFYDFFKIECGLIEETKKVNGLIELAKNAGWFLPHENICWVSERPCILNTNEQGRLHCLTGPAVQYPDGWKIYAVNGVRLKEWIIENPEKITVEKIDEESNLEIKRVMIDFYGQEKYLINSNAKLIHEDNLGKLYRKEINNDEPLVMVKVINSTPEPDGIFKEYFLRVPPSITKASDAVSWTFGMNSKEYRPEIET
jgi:hypothetical protein